MICQPDQKYTFTRCREEAQNPYTGFMSFQHFRGGKLYSDIVVTPEAKMTETERVECYPVSPDAEEKGWEHGWYPDTTIAYIRFLWKEFEPRRGEYNYAFMEDILSRARASGQSLIIRLMAHSTREQDDVPDWLRELIPCPARPAGKRVKDSPKAPEFLALFLEAVKRLGERFDSDPALEAVDISLPGAWGEGHQVNEFPPDTLTRITDTYIEAFPTTRLIAQCIRPDLIRYAGEKTSVGWRGDGLGEPRHTFEVYPERVEKINDVWKTAPVSFESYWWLGEWKRKGWDIDRIIEQTLEWHLSSFNAKSIAIPPEYKEKVEYWISRMGYHFAIDSAAAPACASPGDTVLTEICIENTGVAPIYKKLPFIIRLRGAEKICEYPSDADITAWLPGKHSVSASLALPGNLPRGAYELEIGIGTPDDTVICFCTDAPRTGKFYSIAQIIIQ